MVDYFREKSENLLDFHFEEQNELDHEAHTDKEQESLMEAGRPPSAERERDDHPSEQLVEDVSMAEPIDMDLFLELAQELEAEEHPSPPALYSPKGPILTPLIRLGPERPPPSFDWIARQKDAVQITWETQDMEQSARVDAPSQLPGYTQLDELPGETQLRGHDGALEAEAESLESADVEPDVEPDANSEDELPTMTQLQGDFLAPLDDAPESSDSDGDELPPPSMLDGESDAFAESEEEGSDSDSAEGDGDFPTETQLHGYVGAFAGTTVGSAAFSEDEENDGVLPSETQLGGDDKALVPQPLESLAEEEEEEEQADADHLDTDGSHAFDRSESDDEALATRKSQSEHDDGIQEQGDDESTGGSGIELPEMDELAGTYAALDVTDQPPSGDDGLGEDENRTIHRSADVDMGLTAEMAAVGAGTANRSEGESELEDNRSNGEESGSLTGHASPDDVAIAQHDIGIDPSSTYEAQREDDGVESRLELEGDSHSEHSLLAGRDGTILHSVTGGSSQGQDAVLSIKRAQRRKNFNAFGSEEESGADEGSDAGELLHEENAVASFRATTITDRPRSPRGTRERLDADNTSNPQRVSSHQRAARRGRLFIPRRSTNPFTDFASPESEDLSSDHDQSSSSEGHENLRGPRSVRRLQTSSPTGSYERFSPPMLLPVSSHRDYASPRTPKASARLQERDPRSSIIRSSLRGSATSTRRTEVLTPHRHSRQESVSAARSASRRSVISSRRSRSVTGRLGYIAPQDDPYLHDEDGGPLEPNEDYVTPDVYPTPFHGRLDKRTSIPMYRRTRRWTEDEALLLYRTVQKTWWSERTAQQVAWYLHGEWGQMSQKLKAFTVQNMKDKMREIVKTRVRNDRAVVGRARHWLPAGHPDREAYEDEMEAWVRAENDRIMQEHQRQQEEEEEREAMEEAYDEELEEEAYEVDGGNFEEELSDEEVDWDGNAELLLEVDERRRSPSRSGRNERPGVRRAESPVRQSRERSSRRSLRNPTSVVGARWRTDNEDDEVDELEEDSANSEAAEESDDGVSVVS